MSFPNKDSFIFPFLICMPFLFFSCLIASPRTSDTMLNKGGTSRHSCPLPDSRWGSIQSFTIKYAVGWRIFVDALYQVEEIFLYDCLLGVFIMNGCWSLSNFFLHLLICLYTLANEIFPVAAAFPKCSLQASYCQ